MKTKEIKKNKLGHTPKVKGGNVNQNFKLPIKRHFTKEGVHPYDEVKWVKRDASVKAGPNNVFEQKGVEFPNFWSRNAVNIVASKYFYGKIGTEERESSLKHIIDRVVKTIRGFGEKFGHFANEEQARIFEEELAHIILHQKGSFNSPVWFNVGTIDPPQCSACFILSVEDDMDSILEWIKTEGLVFKLGSGAGINLSKLRSKKERLSGGGYSSGPMAFMRGADSVAGMIKSGGTTRRAAKMVVMDVDHPDIMDFIRSKAEEENKIRAFVDAGYNMQDLNDEAWHSIQYQNANNSVRISDEFMKAAENGEKWKTKFRTSEDNSSAPEYDAAELLHEVAKAAWESGDPGVQFDTTINDWHTCPNSGRINASNPCSEYMHIDNSACNLASINLLKFLNDDGSFAVEEFKHVVDILILAQEIVVDGSSYPTQKIADNSHKFRQLGLGFANLGAFLMSKGIPYDSDEGQAWSGAIASLMAGEAYRYSALMAERIGPFEGFAINREPMLRVINKHRMASHEIDRSNLDNEKLGEESMAVWDRAYDLGEKNGFRNAQATVIAPTGTISFMMDCDTTGIEPDFSLLKMKQLVGGGWMKIVNESVKNALDNLGYKAEEVREIVDYVSENGTVENAPNFKEEHLPIFDCAVAPANGTRQISWRGHVRIVAAVQPFISGAISKTFNMSHDTNVDEIAEAYQTAWEKGIKAFAVYRDGSKSTQPLSSGGKKKEKKDDEKEKNQETVSNKEESKKEERKALRKRLPTTRKSETHKFSIVGHEGYLTYSMYENGDLAEMFIRIAKQGSTMAGLLDSFAISVSLALQYGVPLKTLASKYIYSRFEPSGVTENPDIQIASSIVDYIFRYLSLKFLSDDDLAGFGMARKNNELEEGLATEKKEDIIKNDLEEDKEETNESSFTDSSVDEEELVSVLDSSVEIEFVNSKSGKKITSANACKKCGGMMVRTGTCETCIQCGESNGGCG
ncbi:MAG: vitamin B12-dependent ribonucleotide reductase [Candidatus Paceibacterota bacterium]